MVLREIVAPLAAAASKARQLWSSVKGGHPIRTARMFSCSMIIHHCGDSDCYIALQLIRQAMPTIAGVWAILLNFGLSSVAYVIALPHEQWFTLATLLALASTVAGAAGIHGTVKSLTKTAPEQKAEDKADAAKPANAKYSANGPPWL